MSKAAYVPLIKEVTVQGNKFKIKALTFEDLLALSSMDQTKPIEFAKAVMERGLLEPVANIATLPVPLYLDLLKEIMEFSGIGQGNNMFNPSLRQQTP